MLGGSWNCAKVCINVGNLRSAKIVDLIDGSKCAVIRLRLGNGPENCVESNGFNR